MQNLLVDLLNESNKYVKEAHESQRGHEILKETNFLPTEGSNNPMNVEFDEETGGRLAITVQDSMDIDLEIQSRILHPENVRDLIDSRIQCCKMIFIKSMFKVSAVS